MVRYDILNDDDKGMYKRLRAVFKRSVASTIARLFKTHLSRVHERMRSIDNELVEVTKKIESFCNNALLWEEVLYDKLDLDEVSEKLCGYLLERAGNFDYDEYVHDEDCVTLKMASNMCKNIEDNMEMRNGLANIILSSVKLRTHISGHISEMMASPSMMADLNRRLLKLENR